MLQAVWMSNALLLFIIFDTAWSTFRGYTLAFTKPEFKKGVFKATSAMLLAVKVFDLAEYALKLFTMRNRAEINIRILENLEITHKILNENDKRTNYFASIKYFLLMYSLVSLNTVCAAFSQLPKKSDLKFWQVCTRLFSILAKRSALHSMILLYWAFCQSVIFNLKNWAETLLVAKSRAQVDALRIAFWKLENVVKDINQSFGLMILIWLTASNFYVQMDAYHFLQRVILHLCNGDGLVKSLPYGIWTVLAIIDVIALIYPAIIINKEESAVANHNLIKLNEKRNNIENIVK